MKIGVPKEIKNNEFRVGITPEAVKTLVSHGHLVSVESNAGIGSGFSNDDYKMAGATIVASPNDVYRIADMIIKVKEPLAEEYERIQEGQLVYTFFHFASPNNRRLLFLLNEIVSYCLHDSSNPLSLKFAMVFVTSLTFYLSFDLSLCLRFLCKIGFFLSGTTLGLYFFCLRSLAIGLGLRISPFPSIFI